MPAKAKQSHQSAGALAPTAGQPDRGAAMTSKAALHVRCHPRRIDKKARGGEASGFEYLATGK
ncbi:MAG TPA: hypothetical protein PKK58_09930, partial [Opitutaceae bacterium]|nr:hypothetical protein [Opitutaceae bacterium]